MLAERDGPLQALRDLSLSARNGQGRVVLLGGEAGIGKTSLLQEFAKRLGPGFRVLWGGCEALFTPRPMGPVQDMSQALHPEIVDLLARTAAPAQLFPALLKALGEARGAQVLIFEDLHWADHGTLDFIKYLGRRIGVMSAMMILSFRSDEVDERHPLTLVLGDFPSAVASRITLEPLSAEAVARLARSAGQSPEGLHRVTGGNPFFVTELLAGGTAGAKTGLPESIKGAVWARMSRLSPRECELLETISVVPGAVERVLLRSVFGSDGEEVADDCVGHGVLTQGDQSTLKFRHELARQAALARVPQSAQRRFHAKFEAAIAAERDAYPLSRLVFHAAGAEDAAGVLEYAPQAARQAARLGAHQEAAAHLATALRFASAAAPELAAQLHEDWAYEAGLSLSIDDRVIDARLRAVQLWRAQGRIEKAGHNLHWLSRLHWYRGEPAQAARYADEAVQLLEGLPPGPELAMSYSVRSQQHMLNDRMDEAIEWGTRAMALAEQFGQTETRVHALNNVGTALLFSGRPEGLPLMEESLALALANGFHEHAARVYTNLAEYGVVFKRFDLAERMTSEGIAFDTRHDLDSWTHYLVGRQAQLRMEQGRFHEAQTIARGVLGLERLTLVMRLPALMVLAKVRMRLGESDARALLAEALQQALATEEPQHIVPMRLAHVEAAWLASDMAACREHLSSLDKMDPSSFNPWGRGELAVWRRRAGRADWQIANDTPEPHAAELRGDPMAAADAWDRLGVLYEAALALTQVKGQSADAGFARAVAALDAIEARPAALRARELAKMADADGKLPPSRRGPYAAARRHPLGLTARECEILRLISEGYSNRDVAEQLSRSLRTVEHHVSALLEKLNAANRMEAMLRVRNEPWLVSAASPSEK